MSRNSYSGDDYNVSRKVGKALVLPTAPAYSFGGRYERTPADPGPGPGAYGASLTSSRKGTSFGTSTRDGRPAYPSPAGTDYAPSSSPVVRSKPAYSFGGKPQGPSARHRTPGPGAYEPTGAEKLVKPQHGGYSIAQRPETAGAADQRPGPAHYDPFYSPREPHAASLKFRNTMPSTQGGTPGPGEYALRKSVSLGTGKTFGTSRDFRSLYNGVPGPGQYGTPYDPAKPVRASWSVGRATRDSTVRSSGPGPGQYAVQPVIPRAGGFSPASDHKSAPAYTFGGRCIPGRPELGPGPADYGVPRDPGASSKPAFSITGAVPRSNREKVPGPGAYDADRATSLVRSSAPAVSLAWRAEDCGPQGLQPGPGHYSPHEPDGKLGVSLKFRNDVPPDFAANPAPHDYADKDFVGFGQEFTATRGGTRGFTMGARYAESLRDPGPGPQYRIGCSTLGVGPQPELLKSKLDLTVVL